MKGRAEHEQVAKLTARGRLLRTQFWVYSKHLQVFSHCQLKLVSLYQLLPGSIGSTTHQNEKGKRLSTKREGEHGYIPCVCDTLSSRTAPKESSFDHCVPLFAISSKLVPILRVNVENRHSFFHSSAIGHLCGTCASWWGNHEESMRKSQ